MSSNASNDFGEHLVPEPQPSKAKPDDPMYMPFLHGPRVCPGKKFAQVEFVAVIATIFREWRVEPRSSTELQYMKESLSRAEFNMTPKLWKPEKAGVRWVRRGES
jgi:cytochrome P450